MKLPPTRGQRSRAYRAWSEALLNRHRRRVAHRTLRHLVDIINRCHPSTY